MPKSWVLDAALPASRRVIALVALGLAGCGGGGGGSNVKTTPPPPPPPIDTSPMVVSADLAVASGQTITRPVVLDSGADLDNQGKIGGNVDVGVDAKAPSTVTNHAGGTIRGTKTAIRLEHGGEINNAAGSTIEATGTGGTDCGANIKCAIYVGPNDQAGSTEYHFQLVNAGTIIGNVQLDEAGINGVELVAGGVIQGDLRIGQYYDLTLSGDAGTTAKLSDAVTGTLVFGSELSKGGDGTWILDKDMGHTQGLAIYGGRLEIADGASFYFPNPGNANWYPIEIYLREGELAFNRSDDISLSSFYLDTSGYGGYEDGTLVQAGTGVLSFDEYEDLPNHLRIERGTMRFGEDGDQAPMGGSVVSRASIENAGSLEFFSRNAITLSGIISGTGSVTQNGSAPVSLLGANTYTGGTTVNHGVLSSSQILPGNVVVNPEGTLYAYPGVAGSLSNAGALRTGSGVATVGGDYAQASSATLAVSLGSKLAVAGAATLDGGTLEVSGAEPGYVANAHTEVLTAAGGVTGTFDQLVKDAGVVFTSTSINYDANSVWLDTTGLDVTQAAVGGGIGYTPASMNAAERVQGAFEQINGDIAKHASAHVSDDFLRFAGQFQRAPTIAAAQASLRSLSGELHAASAAMTFRAIDAGNQALSDHLDGVRDGRAALGMWTKQLGNAGGMARSGFDGVGFQLDGWLVGNDFRVGRSGVLGFAFGQGQGLQQLQGGFDRDSSRRTEGMVYAGLAGDRWYAQGRLGFGQFRQDVSRALLLGAGAEGVWTRYGGRYQVAYGETGLRYGFGELRIAPFASIEYARSERDAFAEAGAGGFGLRSDAQSQARWQAGVGVRATRQWSFSRGRTLDLGAHAQSFRASGTSDPTDASFVGLQQWSPLLGIGLSRYGSLVGFGLDARLSPRASLTMSYDYERGQYDSAQGMTAGVNVAF